MEPIVETTTNAAGTEALAARLAAGLAAGDVVVIAGDLGAGKTTFVRGAARALGARGPITSPTFTIGHVYEAPVPVAHLDLYRLGSLDDEEPGLLDEYLAPDAIAFVEWPGVAGDELDRVAARVEIEHRGGDVRRITISPAGPEAVP